MAKVVYVEKDDCTACSQCTDNLPKYFKLDDDGLAESANGNAAEVAAEDESLVQQEIDDCPGECIHWK